MAILNARIWKYGAEIGLLPADMAEEEPGSPDSSTAHGVEDGGVGEEVEEELGEELEEELEAMYEEIMAEGPDYRKCGAGDVTTEMLESEKLASSSRCGAGIDPVSFGMDASTTALLQRATALLDRFRGSRVCSLIRSVSFSIVCFSAPQLFLPLFPPSLSLPPVSLLPPCLSPPTFSLPPPPSTSCSLVFPP